MYKVLTVSTMKASWIQWHNVGSRDPRSAVGGGGEAWCKSQIDFVFFILFANKDFMI